MRNSQTFPCFDPWYKANSIYIWWGWRQALRKRKERSVTWRKGGLEGEEFQGCVIVRTLTTREATHVEKSEGSCSRMGLKEGGESSKKRIQFSVLPLPTLLLPEAKIPSFSLISPLQSSTILPRHSSDWRLICVNFLQVRTFSFCIFLWPQWVFDIKGCSHGC